MPACELNKPDAVARCVNVFVVHLLLRPVWMQRGECQALGKGVNACGRNADYPLHSSLGEVIVWLSYFVAGFKSASLNWNAIVLKGNKRDS